MRREGRSTRYTKTGTALVGDDPASQASPSDAPSRSSSIPKLPFDENRPYSSSDLIPEPGIGATNGAPGRIRPVEQPKPGDGRLPPTGFDPRSPSSATRRSTSRTPRRSSSINRCHRAGDVPPPSPIGVSLRWHSNCSHRTGIAAAAVPPPRFQGGCNLCLRSKYPTEWGGKRSDIFGNGPSFRPLRSPAGNRRLKIADIRPRSCSARSRHAVKILAAGRAQMRQIVHRPAGIGAVRPTLRAVVSVLQSVT